jgi:hypothetical protein
MGIFALGNVMDAAMGRKLKRIYTSDPLQQQIDKSIGGVEAYRGDVQRGLADYGAANVENVEAQKRYAKMAEGEIGSVLGDVVKGDFLADRERTREGDITSLTNLLAQVGGGMSASDKAAQARLGYAGRPTGTYADKARQAYLGAFAAPLAQTIYGGLTGAASGAEASRRAKAGTTVGLIEARAQQPERALAATLNPARARGELMGTEIGLLGGLGDVNKANFAGFKEEKNKFAAMTQAVDESLNSAVDTYASMYTGGLSKGMFNGGGGGGGGGGMLAGLFGGGGGGGGGSGGPGAQMGGYGGGYQWAPQGGGGPMMGYGMPGQGWGGGGYNPYAAYYQGWGQQPPQQPLYGPGF